MQIPLGVGKLLQINSSGALNGMHMCINGSKIVSMTPIIARSKAGSGPDSVMVHLFMELTLKVLALTKEFRGILRKLNLLCFMD